MVSHYTSIVKGSGILYAYQGKRKRGAKQAGALAVVQNVIATTYKTKYIGGA